jgi:hypothetical protein
MVLGGIKLNKKRTGGEGDEKEDEEEELERLREASYGGGKMKARA